MFIKKKRKDKIILRIKINAEWGRTEHRQNWEKNTANSVNITLKHKQNNLKKIIQTPENSKHRNQYIWLQLNQNY